MILNTTALKYISYFILFIFITIMSLCKAQVAYNLTVEELFSLGLKNSLEIQEAEIHKEIYESKENTAKTKRLPSLDVTLANGYLGTPTVYDKNLSYVKKPYMPKWKQNYAVDLKQPIYQGGRIKNSIKYSSIEKDIATVDFEKSKSDIKLWLINNYLELFKLYKQREVFEKTIDEANKRLKNIKNLKRQGIVTNNDVLRSEIEVSNFQLSLEEANNDISLTSQQLDIILGLNEEIILIPDSTLLDLDLFLASEETYLEQAYKKYPDLKKSNFNIEKAEIEKKISESKYIPNLNLNVGSQLIRPITTVSPVQDLYMNSWGVTLGVTYDLFSWFDYKHTKYQSNKNVELQENRKRQIEQEIRVNIKSAYIKHMQALNRVKVLEETVIQAKDNYRITKNKYFNQLAILTDLLDAASVQLDAELQLTVAKANMIYTYYSLLHTSGNL